MVSVTIYPMTLYLLNNQLRKNLLWKQIYKTQNDFRVEIGVSEQGFIQKWAIVPGKIEKRSFN